MRKQKLFTLLTCFVLVAAVAIGGTFALISQSSNAVTNTFTVGSGYSDDSFYLDEATVAQVTTGTANVGGYAATTDGVRTQKGNEYKNLVAGTTLDKDPTFHLTSNAPKSWVVAQITGLDANQANYVVTSIAAGDKWYKVTANGSAYTYTQVTTAAQVTDGYYIYSEELHTGNTTALFTQLTVQGTIDRTAPLPNIVVRGVAVESVNANFADARDAVVAAALGVLNPAG